MIKPGEQRRIEGLRGRICRRLAQAEENASLFNSTWMARVCFLFAKLRSGASFRSVRHQLGLFLAPRLYETVKQFIYSRQMKKRAGSRG